jgi:hypothetical protein
MIAELASDGSKTAVNACPLDEDTYNFPVLPLRGVYLTFNCRGSLVPPPDDLI